MEKILGAQLFTIREFAKDAKELDVTLQKIADMGYTTVQVSALWHIPVDEIAAITKSHGLKTVITHTPYESFVHNLDQVVKDHRTLGCDIAGLGALPEQYRTAEGYAEFAKQFSAIAAELANNSLKFSYHNHNFEFERFGDRLGLEILLEDTDPENFKFTLDTYWVQAGGADPAAWIRKLKGRIEAIHFKDMAIIDQQQIMSEVLEGNLNWPEIFKACEETDVKWYLIERDAGPTDAFDSLRISYNNLRKLGFR